MIAMPLISPLRLIRHAATLMPPTLRCCQRFHYAASAVFAAYISPCFRLIFAAAAAMPLLRRRRYYSAYG